MGWPQPRQVQPMRQAILSVFFWGGVPKYNAQEGGFPNQNRCIRRGKRFCLCFGGGSPKYNAQEGGFPSQNRVQSPRHTVLLFWGAPPHHIVDSDYVEGL